MATGIVHDFRLEIGQVFGLPVYWYGAVYTVGFLAVFGWFALRRRRLRWSLADVLELSVLMAAGILIGGRLFDILVYELDFYAEHPLAALNWWAGGMASHGVLLGGLIGVFLFCRLRRKPFVETADELSVPAAFVMGVGRLGNFIEGGRDRLADRDAVGIRLPRRRGRPSPGRSLRERQEPLDGPRSHLGAEAVSGRPRHGDGSLRLPLWRPALRRRFLPRHEGGWLGIGQGQYFNLAMAAIGLAIVIWAARRKMPAAIVTPPEPRRTSPVLVAVFIFLCLCPLGIPTSWTREHIEAIRSEEAMPNP